jgi:dipeptidyl aminopeptidase/acylaminoacyl peptidase
MTVRILAAAVLAAFFGVHAGAAPLEAYGHLPTLEDVTVSPDGNTLAYVRTIDAKRLVLIQSLQTRHALGALGIGDAKLRDLSWADDKHLLITTSTTATGIGLIGPRHEWFMTQCFNVVTGKTTMLLENRDPSWRAMNVVAGAPQIRTVDGRVVAFVEGIYFPAERSELALFKVDLDSGGTRLVKGGSAYTDWIVDGQGNIVAQSDYRESTQHWTLKLNIDDSWITAVDVLAPVETPEVKGLTEDGSAVVLSARNNDHTEFKLISLKDGRPGPLLRPELHFESVVLDTDNHIIGGVKYTDKADYVFFHPHAEAVWKGIAAAYPRATNVELVSWTRDWNKVVVRVAGPEDGDSYDLIDVTTGRAAPIGPAYDNIGPSDFADVQWITYPASDGRPISGYLTLPKNRVAKNLPLIVLPHGGPFARDAPGFDWLSQGLASRGYAVLQPEFRGSAGFGWDLLSAGFGEFGRKMQTDLSDGVRALAAKGTVDPKRVCIVGASYGGYAALAGATLDTGVYRCAVSDAGLSDLHEFLRHLQRIHAHSDNISIRYWDRFLGISDPDDAALDAISPIKHVDKVTIPVLLIYGNDDTVVPIAQSEDMADALKKAGKQVEIVELDGEDHWLSRSETRLQMLDATVKFVEANNPPN